MLTVDIGHRMMLRGVGGDCGSSCSTEDKQGAVLRTLGQSLPADRCWDRPAADGQTQLAQGRGPPLC